MRRLAIPAAVVVLLLASSPALAAKWSEAQKAAELFHSGKTERLCRLFTGEMLAAMPCDALARVARQTEELVGAPLGACEYAGVHKTDPDHPGLTQTVFTCGYAREDVKVTVILKKTSSGRKVGGLWAESPVLLNNGVLARVALCAGIGGDNMPAGELERSDFKEDKLYVWTEWLNLQIGDELRMKWNGPGGEPVADIPYSIESRPDPSYNFWTFITPASTALDKPGGRWSVDLFKNGEKVDTFSFVVVTASTGANKGGEQAGTKPELLAAKPCGGIDQDSFECSVPLDNPSRDRDKVIMWTEWKGLVTGDEIVMEWFAPGGTLAYSGSHKVTYTSKDSYYAWTWIVPEHQEVNDPVGTWTVNIELNGKVFDRILFEMTKS